MAGRVAGPRRRTLPLTTRAVLLELQRIRLPDQEERLAWLAQQVPGLSGSGIIYAFTIQDVMLVTEWLQSTGSGR